MFILLEWRFQTLLNVHTPMHPTSMLKYGQVLEANVSFLGIIRDGKAPLLARVLKHTESALKHRMEPESCSSTTLRRATHARSFLSKSVRREEEILQSSVKYFATAGRFHRFWFFFNSIWGDLRQRGGIFLRFSLWPLKCVIFYLYSGVRVKCIFGGGKLAHSVNGASSTDGGDYSCVNICLLPWGRSNAALWAHSEAQPAPHMLCRNKCCQDNARAFKMWIKATPATFSDKKAECHRNWWKQAICLLCLF